MNKQDTISPVSMPEAKFTAQGKIPSVAQCRQLWDRFSMMEHIKDHSRQVAAIASELAWLEYKDENSPLFRSVLAAALLHDLAKTYCIHHGGEHAAVGGAWVQALTKNPYLSQGVIHHVYWPGQIDLEKHFLPLVVIYSDKRVRHDKVVSLQERFEDLIKRYGSTPTSKKQIKIAMDQGLAIEQALEKRFGVQLNAHTFDSRWLVERT